MNRDLFRERFHNHKPCDVPYLLELCDRCLKLDTPDKKRQIAIEEAAEFAIECSKMNRNMGDIYGLLEEMADISICLEYLKQLHGISDENMAKAIAVKLERCWEEHGPKGENKSET